MAWTTPRTWTSTIVTASDLNTDIRDNLGILKTRIADNGNPLFDRAGGAAKTDSYNAATSDVAVAFNISTGKTLTLYASSGNAGRVLGVVNMASSSADLTVDGNASETIDGSTTVVVSPGAALWIWCDGSGWSSLASRGELVGWSVGTLATATTSFTTSWADTGLTVTHTAKHAKNLLLVVASVPHNQILSTTNFELQLLKGSTQKSYLYGQANEAGSAANLEVLEEAGDTSANTWKVQAKRSGGTLHICRNNSTALIRVMEFNAA